MQSLSIHGIQEMSDAEMMAVDGGIGCLGIGLIVVGLILLAAAAAE
jgi:lactobin A/cerein 7B family class IIb bacteriocin